MCVWATRSQLPEPYGQCRRNLSTHHMSRSGPFLSGADGPEDLASVCGPCKLLPSLFPACTEILASLHQVLSADSFPWSEHCQHAFDTAKQTLSDAVMLVHPQPNAATCITTDASNVAVGAVLEQFIDGQWRPISFFSKKLNPAQINYSIPFTANVWQLTWPCAISSTLSKAGFFTSTPTTSPWPSPCWQVQSADCPDKLDIYPTSPSSPFKLNICPANSVIIDIYHTSLSSPFDALKIEGQAIMWPMLFHTVFMFYPKLHSTWMPWKLASAQLDDAEIQQLVSDNTSLQVEHVPIPNSNHTVLCDTSLHKDTSDPLFHPRCNKMFSKHCKLVPPRRESLTTLNRLTLRLAQHETWCSGVDAFLARLSAVQSSVAH